MTDGAGHDGPRCSLDGPALDLQLDAWTALGAFCRRLEHRDGAVVAWFDAAAGARLAEVVAAERSCCSFLDIELGADGPHLRLGLAPGRPGGEAVVDRLAAELARGGAPAAGI